MKKDFTKREFNFPILVLIFCLLIIGSIMVYSRTYSKVLFIKHILIIIFSNLIGLLIFFYNNFFKFIKKYFILIYILNLLLLIIPIIFKNTFSVNNSYRWIRIGFFSFQPSEFAKLTVVFLFSNLYSEKKSRIFNFRKDFSIPLILVSVYILLILLQKDLSTAIVFSIILIISFFINNVPFKYILYILIVGFCTFILVTISGGYRSFRLLAFFDPFSYSYDIGYQTIRSFTAIVNGGLFGKGLGSTLFSGNFLPLSYSDFIFSAINEELGIIAGLSIVFIYFLFFLVGLKIIKAQNSNFLFLMSFFIVIFIIIQAILNIFVSLGLLPPTGLTLPFISYGGSSNLIFIIMIWILLKIDYFEYKETEEIKEGNYEV